MTRGLALAAGLVVCLLLAGRPALAAEDDLEKLRADLAAAKADIQQLRARLGEAMAERDKLTDRLTVREIELQNAVKEVEKLTDDLASAKDHLRRFANPPEILRGPEAIPPLREVKKLIRGKVTGVDKDLGLVILNVGHRHEVVKGYPFTVTRDGKHIGRVIVDEVFPDLAATHYDRDAMKGDVEVGDDVVATPEPKGERTVTKIVALGDSTTNCVGKSGVAEAAAWRSLVAADLAKRLKHPVEVVNAGVDADVAPLALKRLERDVLDRKPDWVVVMLGTNDAGFFRPPNGVADTPRVPLEEFEKSMREIVGRIRKAGAGVVLCTSLPMSGHYGLRHLQAYQQNGLNYLVKQYAEVTRRVAKEFGLPLAEVHEAFEKHPQRDAMIPDGIHPNAAGQRLIADTLLPVLATAVVSPKDGKE